MNFQKIVFLILLLIISISMSFLIGSVFGENIFDLNGYGFQFLIFSILGSFIFFCLKYLKSYDMLIVVIFISSIFTYLMRKTSLNEQIGGVFQIFLYSFMLFITYSVIFKFTWFRFKYVRNIMFSILEAFGYVIVHLILHILIKKPIEGSYVLIYFLNGLKIMITLGVSFSIVEYVNARLEQLFFKDPERIPSGSEADMNGDLAD
ncbi:MAG: hypothetical protein HOD64_07625 [Candidatus Cloacimonetes bacterium]|nr:hypothetical protein [Candidatus Cloacimonadota bacterium]